MKRLIPSIFLPILLFLLPACSDGNYVIYTGMEAGMMDSGIFTSDENTKLNVVGNEGNYDVRTSRRVLISYETHQITDPNRIDIDLKGLLDAAIVLPDAVDTLPEDPDGTAIQVTDAWFGGGYLNILISFPGTDASKHAITSTFNTGEDGVTLRLHHDASTDTATGNKAISAFLSVPVYDLQQSYEAYARSIGQQKAIYPMPVILQWSAHAMEGGPLAVYERKGSWSPAASD